MVLTKTQVSRQLTNVNLLLHLGKLLSAIIDYIPPTILGFVMFITFTLYFMYKHAIKL